MVARKVIFGIIAGCALLTVGIIPLRAQSNSQPATLEPLIRRLASDSFVEREAAQAELEKIPPEQFPAVAKLADFQADPEIKARLLRRAEEMELYVALNPPPLSLDVRDASLKRITDELNRQLGTSSLESTTALPVTFTLQAQRQSLADIFLQLDRQHRLTFTGASPLQILPVPPPAADSGYASVKGFVVWASTARLLVIPANVALVVGPGAGVVGVAPLPDPSQLVIRVTAIADPRVTLGPYNSFFQITAAQDELGRDLQPLPLPGQQPGQSLSSMSRGSLIAASGGIMVTDPPGKKLAIVKGTLHASVVLRRQTFVIDDLQKMGETSMEKVFSTTAGDIRITLPPDGLPHPPDAAAPPAAPAPAAAFAGLPANNRGGGIRGSAANSLITIWAANLPAGARAGIVAPSDTVAFMTVTLSTPEGENKLAASLRSNIRLAPTGQGPFRLEICVPTKIAEFTLPIELKNVPVPGQP